MKNFEKYFYEIASDICIVSELVHCGEFKHRTLLALDPTKHNIHTVMKWLNEEYVEPIKLTHDEYVILKNLPSESKYIVRDGLGDLETWDFKPIRGNGIWTTDYESYFIPLTAFSHLFQFIKWEDEEPYEIAKLIEDYEKEHEDGN